MADYGGSAYGAAGAGSEFDPVEFFRRPDVIIRIVGWVFAIIVFGCICDQGWANQDQCFYNGSGACSFGVFVGVMAFLILMGFLATAFIFGRLSNVRHREWILVAEMIATGLWAFLYFVAFCYLTNKWSATKSKRNHSAAQAAIAFCFFSIFIFVALAVLAVKKYRMGVSDSFQSDYNPDLYGGSTPSPFPAAGSAYQGGAPSVPPFSGAEDKSAGAPGGYQQATY